MTNMQPDEQPLLQTLLCADLYAPGEHEIALSDALETLDCRQSNFQVEQPITIMLFTNRSGSSLLGEYLRATQRFSGFGEPLSHTLVRSRATEHGIGSLAAYLQWLTENVARKDTQFGMKLSLDQVVMLLRHGALPDVFPHVNWIHIYRRDLLAQAISFSIAAQTQAWQSFEASNGQQPVFDFDQILTVLQELSTRYERTRRFMNLHDLRWYELAYEDFVKDPTAATLIVAQHCGESPQRIDTSHLRMRSQSSGLNDEFRERFLAQYQRDLLIPVVDNEPTLNSPTT